MKTVICEETNGFGLAASSWCREQVVKHGARSIFIPAGNTPIALYQSWQRERPNYLKGLKLLQIDEVLTGKKKGLFKAFFQEHLPDYCRQISFIENGDEQADLAVLGLGLNGHVAFHEPGLPSTFYSGCISLSQTTVANLDLEPGTWGLSYGAGAFLKCKSILFIVSGGGKREILKRFLASDQSLPASALAAHPDVTVLADREAMPLRGFASVAAAGNGEPKENAIS